VDRLGRFNKPDFLTAMGVVMSMSSSVRATEWKPQDSAGKHSQGEMPFLGQVGEFHQLPQALIHKATFSGCLGKAALHSGMEDHEIADAIPISHGYMSKFMRNVGQQWAKRLVKFMHITQSLAPLQWIADQMGCDVVMRSSKEALLAEARAKVAEYERLLGGRVA
jgi:hypothetical protein